MTAVEPRAGGAELPVGLFARLQEAALPIRERIATHPFVRGLGDGTLPGEKYQFYLRQDYRFLIEYCRVLALAVASSDDLAVASRFADVLNATINTEMDLHREVCWSAGISPEALEETRASPATTAYTNHLLATARAGDLLATLAAILPCAYGYYEIASHLREAGLPAEPLYANWITLYTSDEYEAIARWEVDLFDRLSADASPAREAALREVFLASQRYEYLFWESAWRMEEWPI